MCPVFIIFLTFLWNVLRFLCLDFEFWWTVLCFLFILFLWARSTFLICYFPSTFPLPYPYDLGVNLVLAVTVLGGALPQWAFGKVHFWCLVSRWSQKSSTLLFHWYITSTCLYGNAFCGRSENMLSSLRRDFCVRTCGDSAACECCCVDCIPVNWSSDVYGRLFFQGLPVTSLGGGCAVCMKIYWGHHFVSNYFNNTPWWTYASFLSLAPPRLACLSNVDQLSLSTRNHYCSGFHLKNIFRKFYFQIMFWHPQKSTVIGVSTHNDHKVHCKFVAFFVWSFSGVLCVWSF
jgi:hypothetical protein